MDVRDVTAPKVEDTRVRCAIRIIGLGYRHDSRVNPYLTPTTHPPSHLHHLYPTLLACIP